MALDLTKWGEDEAEAHQAEAGGREQEEGWGHRLRPERGRDFTDHQVSGLVTPRTMLNDCSTSLHIFPTCDSTMKVKSPA